MRIESTAVYRGPNIHALLPLIHQQVDLQGFAGRTSTDLGEDFATTLLELLPGLSSRDDFAGDLARGMPLPELLARLTLELQRVAGSRVDFCRWESGGDDAHCVLMVGFDEEEVAIEAADLALNIVLRLAPADLQPAELETLDLAAELEDFVQFAQNRALGPSTGSLVAAAEARGIPWLRLDDRSLVQLGHGRYQQRLQATITGRTSQIAVELASDKEATNRILADLGLPVPEQRLVYRLARCLDAAERIGYPVVVKPLDGNHGRGVSTNLNTPEEVEVAYDKAKEESDGVIVEQYLTGLDHRLLVINGQLIAAAKRVPGHVVGDGHHTVAELVEIVNQDPRRGVGHEKVLTRLVLDHQAERLLAQHGYKLDSVPAPGEVVMLRTTANLSTGGTSVDVTDDIHPDNREMAERAVQAVGLDVGGVDFLSDDITRSYREVGGGICEVNAAPGFRMHVAPGEGTPRDAAGPVIEMLFPPGAPCRIPTAAITGTNGKTTTSRMLAHILKMAGRTVGLTTTDGVYVDGQLTVAGDMTGPVSARMVLRDPRVDAAVLETARGGLLRSGLGFQAVDVSCCLNISSDHLGLRGIDTLEQLAHVKRVVVEVATDMAVLNADDPHCLKMADHARARRIGYITMNHEHPLVREHIRLKGFAVVLEQGINGHMISLYDHGQQYPLLWTHLIPATLEGRALHNVQNAMFAAALAYAMDVHLDDIRQGLRTFDTNFFQTPGRMNVYDELPFRVILDYAHNPAAVQSICQVVERFEVTGRKILVLGAPGDRRDEDIAAVARTAAPYFDYFVLKADDNPRGRPPEEVPELIARELRGVGVAEAAMEIVLAETAANDRALSLARDGDLVLTLAENVTRTWKQIIYFKPAEGVAQEARDRQEAIDLSALGFDEPHLEGLEIIRDERGVRLLREPGSER